MSFSSYPNLDEEGEYPCEIVEPGSTANLNCYKCKLRNYFGDLFPCYDCDVINLTGRCYYQQKEVTDDERTL